MKHNEIETYLNLHTLVTHRVVMEMKCVKYRLVLGYVFIFLFCKGYRMYKGGGGEVNVAKT